MALVAAIGAFVAAFVFAILHWGLPIDREQVLAWTLGLVVVVSLATGHRFNAARAGLAGFILLPTMPPWLASLHGHIDEVQGVATRGWRLLNLDIAETLIDKGHATVNLVAAFPSLHAAYPALIAAFFWTRLGRPGRMVLVAYPLAMALTLVISGDHYVIDIIGGWAVVGIVVAGWGRMSSRPAVSRWLTT